MPEFHIDLGESATTWRDLDSFTTGYIEAAFWTEGCDDLACDGKSLSDLAPETMETMKADCTAFNLAADKWLEKAYLHFGEGHEYTMRRAGVDFWLTRNGHGAGFWDRDLGEAGDKLTEIAHGFGGIDLYVGDDGRVYA